jgi:uncharacterized protein YndB with AHSA1/START domain
MRLVSSVRPLLDFKWGIQLPGEDMSEKLHHATIKLEHAYSASVERIFSEFANPQSRAKWSAPSNDALVYDESDFRDGGRDVFRCGPANDLRFQGITTYQAIVPNRYVISTEIVTEGGSCLAVALNTLEFKPTDKGSNLAVTIQVVSFVGPDMIQSYESGNRAALDGLSRHLDRTP